MRNRPYQVLKAQGILEGVEGELTEIQGRDPFGCVEKCTRDGRRALLAMREAASLRRSLSAAGDMAADAARTRSAGLRPTAARACHGSAWRCAARTLHCTKLRQQGEAPELER